MKELRKSFGFWILFKSYEKDFKFLFCFNDKSIFFLVLEKLKNCPELSSKK